MRALRWLVMLGALLAAGHADAFLATPLGLSTAGCSNSLDLSQACNSQYIPAVLQ